MPFSSPFTMVPSHEVLASEWNAEVRDCVIALKIPPLVKASRVAAQSIPENAETVVAWDYTVWDLDTMHDNSVNNSRITVNTSGYYMAGAGVRWAPGPSTGYRKLSLFTSNANQGHAGEGPYKDQQPNPGGDESWQTVSGLTKMTAGDYFFIKAYQNSGGGVANNIDSCYFWAALQAWI